jgi:uncharacterized membrane protein YqjE
MAGRPMPFRNPAGHAGVLQNLTSLVASLTQFAESRLELAGRESKAALFHFLTLVGLLIAAAILLLFGYVFLIACLVVAIAHWIGVAWVWTALVVALVHFAGALLCFIIARAQVKRPVFRDTASVLKEDTEWLKNLNQPKRP